MTEHFVVDSNELDNGSKAIVSIEGNEIAVFCIDDEYYAVANYCPHQSGPLCEGKTKGRTEIGENGWNLKYTDEIFIECPWHTWSFDITTGINAADEQYSVPTYDTVVRKGKVYVEV